MERRLRSAKRAIKGGGLPEYMALTSVMGIAVAATIYAMGGQMTTQYNTMAWAFEEPLLLETGFQSPFKDQKVMGIARDYEGTVTFMFEEAGFRNALGMYKVDEEGVIYDIRILFSNASAVGSGGQLIPGESKAFVHLRAGDQVGFFVASNGYSRNKAEILETGTYRLRDGDGLPATVLSSASMTLYHVHPLSGKETAVRSQYAHELFWSHANPGDNFSANGDGYPHTVGFVNKSTGVVTLGFEDLWNGGDKDYDDVVLEFDIGRSNAAVLDPNLEYDYVGYDSWVNRLRLSEQ